jgi:beta-galactosidase
VKGAAPVPRARGGETVGQWVRCMTYRMMALLLMMIALGVSFVLPWHATARDGRVQVSINDAWRFFGGEVEGAQNPEFDDSAWQRVSLPHTWNAADAFNKEVRYRQGIGWYRRSLPITGVAPDRRIVLHFEGANQVKTLFVNGSEVGEHVGGYTAFAFDITDFVSFGGENVIAVRVDNRHDDDIPPLNADFTFYGGIYRNAWLIETDPVHIDVLDHASPGIFLDTPLLQEGNASVRIRGSIVNRSEEEHSVVTTHRILDSDRREVASVYSSLRIEAAGRSEFSLTSDPLPNARLWSPDDPYLYTVRTEVRLGDRLVDAVENPLGLRWVQVDPERGFLLNGEPLKLLGTNRHQDYPGLGNALPDALHRRDVEIVKDTGFNFLRTAHYPQARAVLDASDRLGLIVWEETPIVNIITMSDAFSANSERMLIEMIRQHYNHPSIAFWGYMNEVMLRIPDPIPEGYYEHLVELAERLEARLKHEDEHRISVTAISLHEIDNDTGFGEVPDVHGMNLYFGWYYDDFATWGTYLDSLHAARPDRVYMVTEYGAGSDERVHTEDGRMFDFSSGYMQDFHMSAFPQLLERDYIVATGVWNQFDFGSNHRQDTKNGLNQKGLLFYDRSPKDIWYYYRAMLRDDVPVLYIGRERSRWGGVDDADRRASIRTFTNCERVEFALNGSPAGSFAPQNAHIDLALDLGVGDNRLVATGSCGGDTVHDVVSIVYEDAGAFFSDAQAAGSRLTLNVGAHYDYVDAAGVLWLRESADRPDRWRAGESSVDRIHHRMYGTMEDPLYQSFRRGAGGYAFDVAPGRYEIELGFMDPDYHDAGRRVFDIVINDVVVRDAFDIAGLYGRWRAGSVRTDVNVGQEGRLEIDLRPREGMPVLSSISMIRR